MREILFRGKRSDGEWAFGSLLKVTFDGTTYNLIFADNFLFVFGQAKAMEHAAVIPETVGQFTGLLDKNGKKIFEGDIVNVLQGKDKGVASVGFENGTFMLYPRTGNIYERSLWAYWYNDWEVEIIGNIHDNPELLGGGGR